MNQSVEISSWFSASSTLKNNPCIIITLSTDSVRVKKANLG